MIFKRGKYDLNNKNVLITGATGGLGVALVETFLKRNSNVVATAKNREKLEKLAERFNVKYYDTCNLEDLDDIDRFVNNLYRKFDSIDILVNNAGVGVRKKFLEHSRRDIEVMINVNLKGLIYLTYKILSREIGRRTFVVYNISSGAGLSGIEELTVYSASKFGVVGFTEALNRELKSKNVRVYALCPGGIDTPMHRKWFPEHKSWQLLKPKEVAEKIVSNIENDIGRGRCISMAKFI